VSKTKLIALGAGRTRHNCAYTSQGDYMTMNKLPMHEQMPEAGVNDGAGSDDSDGDEDDEAATQAAAARALPSSHFLLPFLRETSHPAKALGSIIKARMGEEYSAGGLRVGAVNALARWVPAEIAVHATGHDLTGLSALWNYMRASVALLAPSLCVLGGWPAPPYGQLGSGPVPADLSALHFGLSESMACFSLMLALLLQVDSSSNPAYRAGGAMRPALEVLRGVAAG
jgi:hypothetical protein